MMEEWAKWRTAPGAIVILFQSLKATPEQMPLDPVTQDGMM
jgi:hypothetical protein